MLGAVTVVVAVAAPADVIGLCSVLSLLMRREKGCDGDDDDEWPKRGDFGTTASKTANKATAWV